MFVIGLTGGIGTGKTTVSQLLEEQGVAILNADLVGHEVYLPGMPAYAELVEEFGDGIVGEDGTIDRKKLGAIVFADPENLTRLNAIIHPRMKELMREKLERSRPRAPRSPCWKQRSCSTRGGRTSRTRSGHRRRRRRSPPSARPTRSGIPIEQVLERIQVADGERASERRAPTWSSTPAATMDRPRAHR